MADSAMLDPMGRTVVLHDHTWYGHIVKVHSNVAGCRSLAEQAVRAPSEIQYSKSDADCRIYYGAGPRADLMIAVVADVVAGVVKTVHLAKRISGGGVEWSSPTP